MNKLLVWKPENQIPHIEARLDGEPQRVVELRGKKLHQKIAKFP
jgi:hypothetical protein